MSHGEKKELSRRDFLRKGVLGAAAFSAGALGFQQRGHAAHPSTSVSSKAQMALFPPRPPAETRFQAEGTVVRVLGKGSLAQNGIPSEDAVQRMVNRALMELVGVSNPREAWSRFVKPDDRVLIKPNAFGSPSMAAHPETAWAIVAGLRSVGVPDENIIIYDQFFGRMQAARYRVTLPTAKGVRVLSSKQVSYETQPRRIPPGRTQLALPVLWASVIIDVPVLKTHDLAGVTCAMKNITHGVIANPGAFHRDGCAAIPHLWAIPEIKDKVKLIIGDGLKLLWEGGPHDKPKFKVPFESIFATTDPVAMDRLAWDFIDEVRKAKGKLPLAQAGRPPKFIEMAATLGLGVASRERIRLMEVKM